MPEGPEATFLTHYINNHFKSKYLEDIEILAGRYIRHGAPVNFDAFKNALPLKLKDVTKKGKVIFFHFVTKQQNDWFLISKLGMSGWWYKQGDEPNWRKPTQNIILHFKNQQPLIFSDFMNYGTLTITYIQEQVQKEKDKLAFDILDKNTTFIKLSTKLTNISKSQQNKLIEDAIVDQQLLLSGIGNYLKAEILYDAKISPLRKVGDITINEWKQILKSAKKISHQVFDTLINTLMYKKINPEMYEDEMKVYNKKLDPYGNIVQTRKTKSGRTTYWVPKIQK